VHEDYRNGYYYRDLDTQFGAVRGLRVPRLRFGRMQYQALRNYQRRAPWACPERSRMGQPVGL